MKEATINNLHEEPVTLRFDLGSHYIFNDVVKKFPLPEQGDEMYGYEESRSIILACYKRYNQRARKEQKLTDEEVREAFFSLNLNEVIDITRWFWAVLYVEHNPDIQKILDNADKEQAEKENKEKE